MGPRPREVPGMACSTCYYLVISSTHLSNGHFRRVKGVFRGPLCPTATSDSPECAERALGCSAEDLKALFYCELCDKQYLRHQEFDNHINSYDHAHKQRLKELKHREFARNVASKSWKDHRKQEKALRRLHQLAQHQQETQRVPRRTSGLRRALRTVSQQQDKDGTRRDHSPGDKCEPTNHPQRAPATQPPLINQLKDPCRSPSQTPLAAGPAESSLINRTPLNTGPPPFNSKSCHSFHPQLPLPAQGRVGGRLGVSFCFSRRGPRLEPSASVFSDIEEEDREKREQMKERIKEIMEDINREFGEADERKQSKCEMVKTSSDSVSVSDIQPIPGQTAKEEGQIGKRDFTKEHSPVSTAETDNQGLDSPLSASQDQTQVTIWSTLAVAHKETKDTDSETKTTQGGLEKGRETSPYVCVLSKEDSMSLKWPVSLLKFTKSQPHISYSCNPRLSNRPLPEKLTVNEQETQQNQLCAFSEDSNPRVPARLTPEANSCSQRQTRHELRVHQQEKVQKTLEENINVHTEAHLFGENKNISSSEKGPETERCMLNMENCERAASLPFDHTHSDSFNTNSQNPLGGRLEGARGIRKRCITALSCKLESVTHTGTQGMCIRPSRCECGRKTMCKCACTQQPCVSVSQVSRKKRKASTKKRKLGRRKRGEKGKAPTKRQSAKCKVRSVISTVSPGIEWQGEAGGRWGKKRRQRETRTRRMGSAGSSRLLGRCEAQPVSVSVRKRRPRRSSGPDWHSQAAGEPAEHSGCFSPIGRHAADRKTDGERQRDGDSATFPWRSHFSSHSFSPGCTSKLFWEKGHHSNPRSFIDCCYPDNSCGSSRVKKRKLLHGDRKFIHSKRKSLRHCDVQEEGGKKTLRHSGGRDKGLISDTRQWECMRGSRPALNEGSSRTKWSSKNRAVEWDQAARFSPSPGSWGKRRRHLSTEDADWDRCSVDRWTWGSNDSWEDRGTHKSMSGSGTGANSVDSPGGAWRCAGTRHSSSRHLSSPEWWTGRQTYSCQGVMDTQGSRCHSPRSCSPCSSTSMSELSWEWSRSSTCSGVKVDGLTGNSCRTPSGGSEACQEAKKHSSPISTPSTLSCSPLSHCSPYRYTFAPTAPSYNTTQCNGTSSKQKESDSKGDCGQRLSAPVTTNSSDRARPEPYPSKSKPHKPAKTLLLPLIGKLPSIQRKALRKKGLVERTEEKEREEDEGVKGCGKDPGGGTADSQKYPLDIVESSLNSMSNLCPSQIRTDDKQTGGAIAPPVSFTAEEMDKYRLLQEQAREHMQKVLETTQERTDTHTQTNYTHKAQTDSCGTSEEQYTHASLHNLPRHQTQLTHADQIQRQVSNSLPDSLHLTRVPLQSSFTPPLARGVPDLTPLPTSPPLSNLHHIILPHTISNILPHTSSTSTSSPSPAIHPHSVQLSHPRHHPTLPQPLHLSPLSISSLFPSILLSHHPLPLLTHSTTFHAGSLAPLSPLILRPLNPQPFMDRSWAVKFQQKAL